MNLFEYLDSATSSIFRFEYLQEFASPSEKESIELFSRTGELSTVFMNDWWEFLEKKSSQGVAIERVRLVREPRTMYLDWELAVHKESMLHGGSIRVLSETSLTPAIEHLGDFWLIDDSIVLSMDYSPQGEYLGFKPVEDTAGYREAKACLISNSTALS